MKSTMILRPLHDRVIVIPTSKETQTASGFLLPDTGENERSEQGEVIAVGPGRLLENGTRADMTVAIGNKVMFKKYAPDEVKIEGKEYLVVSESDIIAVIE